MSWNASSPSARFTTVAGMSPDATLQNRQSTTERAPYLIPDPLPGGGSARRSALDVGEPLQQRLLLGRQVRRRPDPHAHEQLAAATLAEPRQPLGAEPVHRPRLRARLHLEHRLAIGSRNLELGTQRRLCEGDREIVHQVVAVPLEARILGDLERGDQVAWGAVAASGRTLPAHREVVMVGDTRWDVDLHRLLGPHPAVPLALGARVEDDRALPPANRAGGHRQELAEDGARAAAHLARPAARGARRGFRAAPRPRAGARGAALQGAK